MNNFQPVDISYVAIIVDLLRKYAGPDVNVWTFVDPFTGEGFWHQGWHFGDDGKAYVEAYIKEVNNG